MNISIFLISFLSCFFSFIHPSGSSEYKGSLSANAQSRDVLEEKLNALMKAINDYNIASVSQTFANDPASGSLVAILIEKGVCPYVPLFTYIKNRPPSFKRIVEILKRKDPMMLELILCNAVVEGLIELVETLCQEGVNVNCVVNDSTPLIAAVHKQNKEAVNTLLRHGADVHLGLANGLHPLQLSTTPEIRALLTTAAQRVTGDQCSP